MFSAIGMTGKLRSPHGRATFRLSFYCFLRFRSIILGDAVAEAAGGRPPVAGVEKKGEIDRRVRIALADDGS
jgi:hypothetical protein